MPNRRTTRPVKKQAPKLKNYVERVESQHPLNKADAEVPSDGLEID